jgi:hypothetical protein
MWPDCSARARHTALSQGQPCWRAHSRPCRSARPTGSPAGAAAAARQAPLPCRASAHPLVPWAALLACSPQHFPTAGCCGSLAHLVVPWAASAAAWAAAQPRRWRGRWERRRRGPPWRGRRGAMHPRPAQPLHVACGLPASSLRPAAARKPGCGRSPRPGARRQPRRSRGRAGFRTAAARRGSNSGQRRLFSSLEPLPPP